MENVKFRSRITKSKGWECLLVVPFQGCSAPKMGCFCGTTYHTGRYHLTPRHPPRTKSWGQGYCCCWVVNGPFWPRSLALSAAVKLWQANLLNQLNISRKGKMWYHKMKILTVSYSFNSIQIEIQIGFFHFNFIFFSLAINQLII